MPGVLGWVSVTSSITTIYKILFFKCAKPVYTHRSIFEFFIVTNIIMTMIGPESVSKFSVEISVQALLRKYRARQRPTGWQAALPPAWSVGYLCCPSKLHYWGCIQIFVLGLFCMVTDRWQKQVLEARLQLTLAMCQNQAMAFRHPQKTLQQPWSCKTVKKNKKKQGI